MKAPSPFCEPVRRGTRVLSAGRTPSCWQADVDRRSRPAARLPILCRWTSDVLDQPPRLCALPLLGACLGEQVERREEQANPEPAGSYGRRPATSSAADISPARSGPAALHESGSERPRPREVAVSEWDRARPRTGELAVSERGSAGHAPGGSPRVKAQAGSGRSAAQASGPRASAELLHRLAGTAEPHRATTAPAAGRRPAVGSQPGVRTAPLPDIHPGGQVLDTALARVTRRLGGSPLTGGAAEVAAATWLGAVPGRGPVVALEVLERLAGRAGGHQGVRTGTGPVSVRPAPDAPGLPSSNVPSAGGSRLQGDASAGGAGTASAAIDDERHATHSDAGSWSAPAPGRPRVRPPVVTESHPALVPPHRPYEPTLAVASATLARGARAEDQADRADLVDLTAKIDRILHDEARRHGIEV